MAVKKVRITKSTYKYVKVAKSTQKRVPKPKKR
jgi:hypothetical protein